jgi:hypothetical protein
MILPIITGSEHEWMLKRIGRFTASQIHRLMSEPKSKTELLSKGAKTYIREVASEVLTGKRKDRYQNNAMERGIELEPIAFAALCEALDLDISSPDIMHFGVNEFGLYAPNEYLAASPDGIILDRELIVELKCPDSATHLEYLSYENADDLKNNAPEYYYQIQTNILLSEAKGAIFASYDDRYPEHLQLKIIEVPQDVQTCEKILDKLTHAITELINTTFKYKQHGN